MKDFDGLILFIFICLVGAALAFGFITAISQSFKAVPDKSPVDSHQHKVDQRRRMDDIQRNQKQLMRDQQYKIRANSRR